MFKVRDIKRKLSRLFAWATGDRPSSARSDSIGMRSLSAEDQDLYQGLVRCAGGKSLLVIKILSNPFRKFARESDGRKPVNQSDVKGEIELLLALHEKDPNLAAAFVNGTLGREGDRAVYKTLMSKSDLSLEKLTLTIRQYFKGNDPVKRGDPAPQ